MVLQTAPLKFNLLMSEGPFLNFSTDLLAVRKQPQMVESSQLRLSTLPIYEASFIWMWCLTVPRMWHDSYVGVVIVG